MTLGEHFKQRRLELGKSLEQISASTKIHLKILSALEEDRYSDLPARAFTRGFIVSYAKALGLNGNHILSQYHDFLEDKYQERKSRDEGHQGYVFEGKELEQNRRWLIFGASATAIFAIAVILVFKPQNHKRKEKHKEYAEETTTTTNEELSELEGVAAAHASPSTSPTTESGTQVNTGTVIAISTPTPVSSSMSTSTPLPKVSASPSTAPSVAPAIAKATPSPIAQASPTTTPAADKLNKGDELKPNEVKKKITFQAEEDVWVRYQVDSKPAMLLILRKGKFLVLKGKEKIIFDTKAPASLKFKTKSATFEPLVLNQLSVEEGGTLKASDTEVKGAGKLPQAPIPAPPAAPTATP